MIDILVYLFENYLPDACPEPTALAKRLMAAGFGDDDISAALAWLAGFDAASAESLAPALAASTGMRFFAREEIARLSVECRGFLAFLEQADAIDASSRELILERALAMPDEMVPLTKFKVIVLMVIWRQQLPIDALVLEELLDDGYDEDDDEFGDPTPLQAVH